MKICDLVFKKARAVFRLINMKQKVGIIGASGAGLYASLFISEAMPDAEIVLIDQQKTAGRKLLATGNGHCNILPQHLNPSAYRYPDWFEDVVKGKTLDDLKTALLDEGIALREVNGLYYPESYHAPTFVDYLVKQIIKRGVRLSLDTKVIDYVRKEGKYILKTSKEEMVFDKLVFSFGGVSQGKLGSDGSLFDVFSKHGYHISELRPGLAPIRTKESTKRLAGIRHEALLSLVEGNDVLYEERGEVIFKKDGLSGICVMNAASVYARKQCKEARLVLDLCPSEDVESLQTRLTLLKAKAGEDYLQSLLVHDLRDYIEAGAKRRFGDADPCSIAKMLKDLAFHPTDVYGFEDSQVTIGGIVRDEVDEYLESKREKGIFFIGECLDNDGLCGGNNLAWCLLTALKVKEGI